MSGLHRIILIDTHLPGVVELKLDSHTNICGTNASGKTTLQRLLPVFYGEYPSRVVPATRDSFERWYLRHESSYIIYEYLRADGELCQTILTSSGKGVDYRFINKGFDLDDYTVALRSKEHKILAPVDLSRQFKRNGIVCTRQLNTREFRAVIQNDRGVLNSSRDLPNMAATFSLASSNNHLRHIEKLAKAVHSKEGKMDTIRAMIAAIFEEDGIVPPSQSIKLNQVENWIKERKLIKGFDALRPQFVKLQQAHDEFQTNDKRLAVLSQQYQIDASALDKQLIEEKNGLEEVQLQNKQTARDWDSLNAQLNKELSEAKADVQTHNDNLEKLEITYDDWQEQDIDALAEKVQLLSGWRSELENSQSQLNLLTKEHQDVESAYHKRLMEIEQKYNRELENFDQQQHKLQGELNEQKSQQQQQEAQIQQQFQQQISEAREEYQQRVAELQIQQTELATLLANVGFTEQEQQQLDLLEANVNEAAEQEDIQRDRLREAEHKCQQIKQQQQQKSAELQSLDKDKQAAQQQVEKVESLLYPGHNTLLEHLRRKHPEWADSIGKVINPELLNRSDLKPEQSSGDDFFGLTLDLTVIEPADYAESEISLQQKLEQVQLTREQAIERYQQCEDELAEINQQLRDADVVLTRVKTEANNAEQNRRRLQADKEDMLREFQQARAERKQSHKQRLEDNKHQQQKVKVQQAQAIEQLNDDLSEAILECRSHWQMLVGDSEVALEQVLEQKEAAKAQVKEQKKQCKNWLKDELSKRDLDVDQITRLKEKTEQLNRDIAETEQNRHKVAEYQYWYKTFYTEQKLSWQQALTQAKKLESKASQALQKEREKFQQTKQVQDEKQLRIEKALKEFNQQQNDLQQVQKLLAKIKLPQAELDKTSETLVQRVSEGQQLLNRRVDLIADIKALVDHFDGQIASQSGSGLADIWEKSREECMYANEQGIRVINHVALVQHLDQLLNIHVPQHLTTLKDTGRLFGKNLAEYHKVLKDIESHIGNQSRRISQAVDGELFLDGVSDSAVKIRSKIAELDFWDDLQAFSKHYHQWLEQGAHDLPGEEYVNSLRTVLDVLGRSALEGGIAKLLDIELHIHEGNSDLVIRTDRQLNESSSHGMAYLILCKFLLAFTRLLRGESETTIHWPIDELGTLHQSNIKKIFDACQNNNIRVLGAFPNPESEVLTLFDNRYLIANKDGQRRLQVVQPKVSVIAERLKKASKAEEVTA